ncbi:MAG TPA: restriction endonuclease subunit S [Pyrinomonadaceae bacterium]
MMKTYERYKPAGVDWLGEIPDQWRTKRLKYVAYMKGRIGWQNLRASEFNFDANLPFLITGMNFKDGVIRWDEVYHFSEERYNEAPEIQLKEGDVLMTKDGTIGKLLYVDHLPGKASLNSHLLVLRAQTGEFIPKYLFYQLDSITFKHHIELTKSGTTFFGISQEATGEYPMILPPLPEQTAIARYLDEKTAQIDKLIAGKERLIRLLKEERTAIINQAVTRGVDADARLKPSGVVWLGDIPEHWKVKKLKYLVSKVGSGITPSGGANVYRQEGVPLLRSQNIHSDRLVLDDVAYISEEVDESMSNSRINEGDVLLNITGASIGRCYFVPEGFGRGNVNQHVCIIRPVQSSVTTEYLHAVLVSGYGQNLIDMCQTGANREGLNFQQIRGFDIPLCDVDEQRRVVEFIRTATGKIDATVAKIEKEIGFVREYRTALISEVVTGKVKVV